MTTAGKGPGLKGHRVFISYCSQESVSSTSDKRTAEMICSALESRKIRCWIAPRDILPGEDWLNSIFNAVEVSKVVVVVFSAKTDESEWVKDEIKFALEKKIKIIPFRIENVEFQGGLRILKVRCQWLDAFKPPMEKHIKRLVEVVGRHLAVEPGKPIVPVKKPKPDLVKKPKSEKKIEPGAHPGDAVGHHQDPEPGKTSKRVEKQPTVDKESTWKKITINIKWVLIVASIIIAVNVAVFFTPKKPNSIWVLKSKGVEIKKIGSNSWEAVYKGDGITMIYIPPGEFMMGQTQEEMKWLIDEIGEKDYNSYYINETPLHNVYLDGYWIGKYEVTFSQYDKYCELTGKAKPYDYGWGRENRPVINVSWDDAAAYCDWLSKKTGLKFKLPTEAQWEKAARGTDGRKYPSGSREPDSDLANFNRINGKTTPVWSYPAGVSLYGLLDMAGNVWEWCADRYDPGYYKISPSQNPPGPVSGSDRVMRGGGWSSYARYLRCAFRGNDLPSFHGNDLGFRLCQDDKDIK